MSTETDTHDDAEAFEAELAARLGAATETVAADGVTREGIDERVAARRASRRRRQGGIVLAAAALVIAAGIGALALGSDEPQSSVTADDGGVTTEVPTTDPPTSPPFTVDTTDECVDTSVGETGFAGSCVGTATTTTPEAATTTAPPSTTTEPPPTTTGAPATTTEPQTTTTQATSLRPGQSCTPGSHRDCIDPDEDGQYQYLLGGADCIAQPYDDSLCTDLDGDGTAGYPDSR